MSRTVLSKEKEYKKLFNFEKRWAKHWLTPSAHRAHSSTISLQKPAQKTLDFILAIEQEQTSYADKVNRLLEFYHQGDAEERQSHMMGSGYYHDSSSFTQKKKTEIEIGQVIELRHMPRS